MLAPLILYCPYGDEDSESYMTHEVREGQDLRSHVIGGKASAMQRLRLEEEKPGFQCLISCEWP